MEVDPLSIGLVASTAALALLSKSRSPPSPKDTNPRQLLRGPLADASDTHPLILAEQSDIATLRYPGRTAVYRSKHTPGDLPLGKRPRGTAKTIWEAFQQGREASRQHGSTRYLGKRERRRGPSSHGDTSDDTLETLDRTFTWKSYDQVDQLARELGSGIMQLSGMSPGKRVGTYLRTSPEWIISELASMAYGLVNVPLFDTWPLEMVAQSVNETGLVLVICSSRTLPGILTIAPKCPTLRHVLVLIDTLDDLDLQRAQRAGLTSLITQREVIDLGKAHPKEVHSSKPDDLARICYTSGSSDVSKGVLLTHDNLISEAIGVMTSIPQEHSFRPNDSYLSYLPMAHVFEQSNWLVMTLTGASIGYYSGDARNLPEDMSILQPTLFSAVPRVLSRIKDEVMRELEEGPAWKQSLFHRQFQVTEQDMDRYGRLTQGWLSPWIFAPVRQRFGGRIRMLFSSASPIQPEILHFFRVTLSSQVLQGYGQTEAAGATNLGLWGDYDREGSVGPPTASVEIVLRDRPDLGYTVEDKPRPRGEILVRGPSLARTYCSGEPVVDEEGWRATGDIGEWTEVGALRIIDFSRSSIKLSQGFHVAPERVEALYVQSPYVHQTFVYADPLWDRMVAIVVPDAPSLLQWAKEREKGDVKLEDLCKDERVKELFLDEFMVVGCQGDLQGFEHVRLIHLHPRPFSIEEGLVTPTMKLRRRELHRYFEQEINDLYHGQRNRRSSRTSGLF